MDTMTTRGICLFLLLIDTLIFGFPPYFLIRGGSSPRSIKIRGIIISYLNCFAGGVFLGACLLHLLAEGREEMETYLEESGNDIDFPLYELAVAVGFFLIALVEQIAHKYLHNPSQVEPSAENNEKKGDIVLTRIQKNSERGETDGVDNAGFKSDGSETSDRQDGKKSVAINAHDKPGHQGLDEQGPTTEELEGVSEDFRAMGGNPIKAFLLLGALSFHTVFDGLAIGLQTDNTSIWEIFVAIVIHKSLVAVCLGLQLFLVFYSKPLRAFFWVTFFACIAPLGLGIAMILTAGDMDILAEKLASWVLQGLATGTFLYVTFFEILKDELSEKGGILKLLVIVIGFAGMGVAKLLDSD